MRIAIDIRALGAGRRTGVEEYEIALLNALFEIDKENEYILFNNRFSQINNDFKQFEKNSNVRIINLKIPNKIFNSALTFAYYPKIDKLCKNPDVFFSPAWNFCRVSKTSKHILTVHDLSFEVSPDFFSFKKRLWHKIIGAKRQTLEVDKIIAVSESTKEDLINIYNINPQKIEVIYLGVNNKFFKTCSYHEKLEIRKKYHLPENFILFIGTIEPRKGIFNLIKSFEEFKKQDAGNMHLVISGVHGWSYREILKAAKNSSFKKYIKISGFIEDADKPAIIQSSKAFVYPSLYEGFGFPPLEAMACKIPTIISNNPSLPEISGNGALMIDPWNIREFAWAMEQIINNYDLREKIIKNGIKCAEKYKWEETAKQTLKVILNFKF